MSWWRTPSHARSPQVDVVERLTTTRRFPPRLDSETVPLDDVDTVRRWIRELTGERDQQVHVRRPWGALAVVADGRNPISVVLADDDGGWSAEPPGTDVDAPVPSVELTPDQVEHVVLEALTSTGRPQWPAWRRLE